MLSDFSKRKTNPKSEMTQCVLKKGMIKHSKISINVLRKERS